VQRASALLRGNSAPKAAAAAAARLYKRLEADRRLFLLREFVERDPVATGCKAANLQPPAEHTMPTPTVPTPTVQLPVQPPLARAHCRMGAALPGRGRTTNAYRTA
jgi:hypothetical protein